MENKEEQKTIVFQTSASKRKRIREIKREIEDNEDRHVSLKEVLNTLIDLGLEQRSKSTNVKASA